MNKKFFKDAFGWGFGLWLFGYLLGIVLFAFVPVSLLGWIITPIGIAVTLWVLLKRVKGRSLRYYLFLGLIWTSIAIICDYFLLVKVFNPPDGYYKLDVYIYYGITFLLPVLIGFKKCGKNSF